MLSLKNPNVNRSRKHTIALSAKSKLRNMFFTNIILIKVAFAQVRSLCERMFLMASWEYKEQRRFQAAEQDM